MILNILMGYEVSTVFTSDLYVTDSVHMNIFIKYSSVLIMLQKNLKVKSEYTKNGIRRSLSR